MWKWFKKNPPATPDEYNKINYPNCRSGYGVIPWSGSDKLSKKATQTEPKGNLSVVFSSYCIGSIPNAWLTVKGELTLTSISCIVSGARLILLDLFFFYWFMYGNEIFFVIVCTRNNSIVNLLCSVNGRKLTDVMQANQA